MEGIRFTQNRQNTRSFGNFLAGNPTRLLTRADIVVFGSSPSWVFPFQILGTFFFKIEIPLILLFLNQNKNS